MNISTDIFTDTAELIINECKEALRKVDPEAVEALVEAIYEADKIFFVGVGRVMLSLQAMAKRLAHLGFATYCVGQITEPAITARDLLIVGSGSGETLVPVGIAKKAKAFGARIAHIGSNPDSSLSPVADIFIRIKVQTKLALPDEIISEQPMTSLFEQCLLLLGDTVAKMIIADKRLNMKELWKFHANLE